MVHAADSGGTLCIDPRDGRRTLVTPDVAAALCLLGRWSSARQIAQAYPEFGDENSIARLLVALARRGLVERSDATITMGATPLKAAAAFFHFATRDPVYPRHPLAYDRALRVKAAGGSRPSPVKASAGERLALKKVAARGELAETLTSRRTWRSFSTKPLRRSQLAAVLQLTFGVQRWAYVEGQGRVALKTSPSAGARHPIEAYVIALNVAGVPAGVYHYASDAHQLVTLNRKASRPLVSRLLANQHHFAEAAAIVVMSAVFGRTTWKYEHSRAYRAILAETGHLAQTFCLVATALDLAPFCTMAFRDSSLDRLLRIDGASEASLYVVGVGTRPPGRTRYPGKVRTTDDT